MIFLMPKNLTWQWLRFSFTNHHDPHKLELSETWEPHTVQDLSLLVQEKCYEVVFLMETKLKTARMEVARRRLNFHRYFVMVAKGQKRGLTLMWKKKTQSKFTITLIYAHLDLD